MENKDRDIKNIEVPKQDFEQRQDSGPFVTTSFSIKGMSCPACARKIEEALLGCSGVIKADVDFGRREVSVVFNSIDVHPDELKAAVKTIGYNLLDDRTDGPKKSTDRSVRLNRLSPYLIGVAAALGVVGFYLGLLTLTSGWDNARFEFTEYKFWILALSVGLGVQATLFSLYRRWHSGGSIKAAKCSMAASGGMSATAMAACCAHYLAVILPVIGLPFLSAAAASLALYQKYFFMAGVLSSLFGIGFMLRIMCKSGMIHVGTLICNFDFGFRHQRG